MLLNRCIFATIIDFMFLFNSLTWRLTFFVNLLAFKESGCFLKYFFNSISDHYSLPNCMVCSTFAGTGRAPEKTKGRACRVVQGQGRHVL